MYRVSSKIVRAHWLGRCNHRAFCNVRDVVKKSNARKLWCENDDDIEREKKGYLFKSNIEGHIISATLNAAYPVVPLYSLYHEDKFLFSTNCLISFQDNAKPSDVEKSEGFTARKAEIISHPIAFIKWKELPGIWLGDEYFLQNKKKHYINPDNVNDYEPYDMQGECNGHLFSAIRVTNTMNKNIFRVYKDNKLILISGAIHNLRVLPDGTLFAPPTEGIRRLYCVEAVLERYDYKAQAFGRSVYGTVNGEWPENAMYTVGLLNNVGKEEDAQWSADEMEYVWPTLFGCEVNEEVESLLIKHYGEFVCAGKEEGKVQTTEDL